MFLGLTKCQPITYQVLGHSLATRITGKNGGTTGSFFSFFPKGNNRVVSTLTIWCQNIFCISSFLFVCIHKIYNVPHLASLLLTIGGLSNHGNDLSDVKNYHETPGSGTGSPQILSGNFNLEIDSLKLEEEIDQVLRALRKAQQTEYKIAEERLLGQKNCLLNLYQQLNKERSELSMATSSDDQDALLEAVLKRVDQIKREIVNLRDMEEVAKGFGKTSKDILDQHFGFETE